MKSPFPGMDPYVEARGLWPDFHHDLITAIKVAITRHLPENYTVSSEDRAYVVLADKEEKTVRQFVSDVGISREGKPRSPEPTGRMTATEAATSTEPRTLRAFIPKEFREAFLEIYEIEPEQRLVTCLEVLSPANKRQKTTGWRQYLRKRQALLMGEANFVEIDLLRGGTRMPMLDPWPDSPYLLLVARAETAPDCKVWQGHFRHPLPVIPVPLSPPDPDVPLDLQPLIDNIYAYSRYHRRIDYTKPLSPPLSDEETAWLAQRLRERGS